MRIRNTVLTLLAAAAVSAPAVAQQSEDELDARMREAEARLAAQDAAHDAAQQAAQEARAAEAESQRAAEDVEVRMREAERRLAEAARQVADLSMSQLPRAERIEQIVRAGGGPALGVTIGAGGDDPVEGVEILAVSPGGAAEEAGLRSGDVITSVNGESLTAESGSEANRKLLDFMSGVEEGDVLDVEFLRNGRNEKISVNPRPMPNAFAFAFNGRDFVPGVPGVAPVPEVKHFQNFMWMAHDGGFGDMELVALTERLGSYFGTSEGLLVVRAPEDEQLKLEDGDVILDIDGRTPSSVSHAMRILGSYQAGETLKIGIMRDQRKRTIEIEMPDSRQSNFRPSRMPVAPRVPRKSVIIQQDTA